MEVVLLANTSKDNIRIADKGRPRRIPMAQGLRIDKLYSYLLTLDTDIHLVYQAIPAYGSTPYPNVRNYKGRIGLSLHAAYPSTIKVRGK
jgi:hypothetical protein